MSGSPQPGNNVYQNHQLLAILVGVLSTGHKRTRFLYELQVLLKDIYYGRDSTNAQLRKKCNLRNAIRDSIGWRLRSPREYETGRCVSQRDLFRVGRNRCTPQARTSSGLERTPLCVLLKLRYSEVLLVHWLFSNERTVPVFCSLECDHALCTPRLGKVQTSCQIVQVSR
jgi:hypothetical protein